jgi:hypothetical protein
MPLLMPNTAFCLAPMIDSEFYYIPLKFGNFSGARVKQVA